MKKNRKMLSILITHYNRSRALKDCLEAIRSINFPCEYEIVISDDGSTTEHLNTIKTFGCDKLLLFKSNQGLTNSMNKGLKACRGHFILYCQEDFQLRPQLTNVIEECLDVLEKDVLDMVRLTANYKFKRLKTLTSEINRIPNFSFNNFNVNTFRYSDHPFITTPNFYETFGYYLENVSGPYGETEYAIRLLKLGARIGITKSRLVESNAESASVMKTIYPDKKRKGKKSFWRLARACRQHLEWVLYNPKKRRLITYKNLKQNQ